MSEKEHKEIVVVTSKEKPVRPIKGVRVVDADSLEGLELLGTQPKTALPMAYVVQRKVEVCELKTEDNRIVAKCGTEELDLGKIAEKDIIEKAVEKAAETDEECPGCAEAVAVGWAIGYIKPLNDVVAKRIFDAMADEKMTPDEAMERCIAVAQNHNEKELVGTLDHLKEIMHLPIAELEKRMAGPSE